MVRRSHHIGLDMMLADRNGGEARSAVGDADNSDSAHSHEDDSDVATISEVFADILTANEDLLHAAAECQLDNDAPAILAYQRILHRNLIEMADFVDAMFGVYNQSSVDKDDVHARDGRLDEEAKDAADAQDVTSPDELDADAHDYTNGDTSEEAIESATDSNGKALTNHQPERIRSLLIDRFRLENRRRSQQRSARLWKKMRRRVRVEEGVSAVSAVMFEAAEQIAKLTVTGAALSAAPSQASLAVEPPIATAIGAAPDLAPLPAPDTLSEEQASTSATTAAPVAPADASADSDTVDETLLPSTPAASPPPPATQPSPAASTPNTTGVELLQFAPPTQQFSMPMLPASLPFATQGTSLLLPAGVDKFTKVALPPMASGFNMMYSMAAVPAPTLFPPDHMSSVCADCVPLNRTPHECRSVRRHITPAPLQQSHAMMFNGTSMWQMPMGGPMAALVVQQPARPVPTMTVAAQSTTQLPLKKVCEECKKCHKSVHYCRKTLGHTAPEWLSSTTTGEVAGEDAPKRKRRSKKQRAAEEAQKAAAYSAAMADVPSPPESDAPVVLDANEI